jgi:hypothetical protein
MNCAKSAQVALAGPKQIDRSVFREVNLEHAAHHCESIDEPLRLPTSGWQPSANSTLTCETPLYWPR